MRVKRPKEYYVYAQYEHADLKPIYIGKGSGGRMLRRTEHPYDEAQILMDGLTETEAFELEWFVLTLIGDTKYNKNMPSTRKKIIENSKFGSPGKSNPRYTPYSKWNQAKFFGTTWYYAFKILGIIKTKYNTNKQKFK